MKKISVFVLALFAGIFTFSLFADECTGISVGLIYPYDYYSELESYIIEGLPESYEGELQIHFRTYSDDDDASWMDSAAVGTYDLGSEQNSSLETCRQCVLLNVYNSFDYSEDEKVYFQESGTLEITLLDEEEQMTNGTLSAKLVQVTIDEDTLETTLVENGDCIEIESASWENICIPDCEGKICGTDGCGGTCGDGCGDKKCNAAQDACVEWDCTQITLPANPAFEGGAYNFNHTPAANDRDFTSLEIYSINTIEAAEYDLSEEQSLFCDICLYLYEKPIFDDEGYFDYSETLFFQESGILKVNSFDSDVRSIDAEFKNVRLQEVVYDEKYGDILPVPGGKCYEIASAPFSYAGDDIEPGDTGDTGVIEPDPTDTGDTASDDTDQQTGSEPSDAGSDGDPADKGDSEPSDASENGKDEEKKSSGCSLSLI